VLPYVALLVLFAVAFIGALLMPEPVAERSRPRLTPQRPSIPAAVRRPFLLAALAVISSWSVGGLFLSLGPSLSATLFGTTNHLVTGLSIFALAGSGAVAQFVFGRAAPWMGAAYGSLALALGMVLIVLAAAADSSELFWLGAIVGGAGFGVAFLGALRALSAVIPHEHRAAVMSAFYIVGYTAISVPAIVAGSVVGSLGLQSTFEIFGSVIAGLALVVAFEAWRTRPAPPRLAMARA
jgi:predicted MFS family arabinose efflux permease